jgi:hypothetical protein
VPLLEIYYLKSEDGRLVVIHAMSPAEVSRGRAITMPHSYEEILNQAEELSRVFEEEFQPAVSRS